MPSIPRAQVPLTGATGTDGRFAYRTQSPEPDLTPRPRTAPPQSLRGVAIPPRALKPLT